MSCHLKGFFVYLFIPTDKKYSENFFFVERNSAFDDMTLVLFPEIGMNNKRVTCTLVSDTYFLVKKIIKFIMIQIHYLMTSFT